MSMKEFLDKLHMRLKVVLFEPIRLVDDIWLLELFDHRWRPIDHDRVFSPCKYQDRQT